MQASIDYVEPMNVKNTPIKHRHLYILDNLSIFAKVTHIRDV